MAGDNGIMKLFRFARHPNTHKRPERISYGDSTAVFQEQLTIKSLSIPSGPTWLDDDISSVNVFFAGSNHDHGA
jgi:hypothetical protein